MSVARQLLSGEGIGKLSIEAIGALDTPYGKVNLAPRAR
jgi:hypothetical protein